MKKRGGQRKPMEEKSENRTVGLPRKLWAPIDKMPGSLAGRMRLIVIAGLQALGGFDHEQEWFCDRCMQIVSGSKVTFSEHHDNCGGKCR